MLTRIRIEVEGADSAAACEEELSKYEHAMQVTEAQRYGIGYEYIETEKGINQSSATHRPWDFSVETRDFYNSQLGREVTDEVIEYDASLPGYRGRRVVQFKRMDTRAYTYGRADQHEVGEAARQSLA
jgi:hypothetical protein